MLVASPALASGSSELPERTPQRSQVLPPGSAPLLLVRKDARSVSNGSILKGPKPLGEPRSCAAVGDMPKRPPSRALTSEKGDHVGDTALGGTPCATARQLDDDRACLGVPPQARVDGAKGSEQLLVGLGYRSPGGSSQGKMSSMGARHAREARAEQ